MNRWDVLLSALGGDVDRAWDVAKLAYQHGITQGQALALSHDLAPLRRRSSAGSGLVPMPEFIENTVVGR